MGSCFASPTAPCSDGSPIDSRNSQSQSPNRSQWTRLFCRHTPYERFDPGHRHGMRYVFGDIPCLARDDLDVDAALAYAVGCPAPPRSLTPTRRPLSDQRGRAARPLRRRPDCPIGKARSPARDRADVAGSG
jgi:hypothetical protein